MSSIYDLIIIITIKTIKFRSGTIINNLYSQTGPCEQVPAKSPRVSGKKSHFQRTNEYPAISSETLDIGFFIFFLFEKQSMFHVLCLSWFVDLAIIFCHDDARNFQRKNTVICYFHLLELWLQATTFGKIKHQTILSNERNKLLEENYF